MINRLFTDLNEAKIKNILEIIKGIAASIAFGFIIYLGYIGVTKFITNISENSFTIDVRKELIRINHGNETEVIKYFYQQNKELTCTAMIDYLNRNEEKENVNIVRLEIFPKFCLNDNKKANGEIQ